MRTLFQSMLCLGIVLILNHCITNNSNANEELFIGKNIKIKFIDDVPHNAYLVVDGYTLKHISTDTTIHVDNPLIYNPEISELSIDRDSLILLNSSYLFMPHTRGWRRQSVTTGLMAVNWIKAFNKLTNNYRDQNYEVVGTAAIVAMTSIVQIRSKKNKNIVIRKPKDFPVLIQVE